MVSNLVPHYIEDLEEIYEGLFYALGAVAAALALAIFPLLGTAMSSMFWFIIYHFTRSPILILTPIFMPLGCLVPLGVYRFVARSTIVERLRDTEN